MHPINYKFLLEQISNIDYEIAIPKIDIDKEKIDLLNEFFDNKLLDKFLMRAVLGIDIYQYSQYREKIQALVPYCFRFLYDIAFTNCLKSEPLIYYNYRELSINEKITKFQSYFIDTGDGGFQIFKSPLQAIVFACYFASTVHLFNAYRITPHLREIIGEISLRYALTYDKCYKYNFWEHSNYYGSSIINNARIMSKDKLNRFLIDENSYNWFMKKIDGVENLPLLDSEQILKIEKIDNELDKLPASPDSLFRPKAYKSTDYYLSHIKSSHIQKIGQIKAKSQVIGIYNVNLQCQTALHRNNEVQKVVSTLGNLNPMGLTD